MKRTIRLESATVRCDLYIEIKPRQEGQWLSAVDLEPVPEDSLELSISAMCWQLSDRGRWLESMAGQCIDHVREEFGNNDAVKELCDIWERWHLNGLKAGTVEQAKALEDMPAAVYPESHNDKALAWLRAKDLETDRGYKYGSKWLHEPLPVRVVDSVQNILVGLG